MAFAAGTIWYNWSTGATTNGGGFDPTNANFLTDLTTNANTANTNSPVVSSASYNFVAGDAGAWLFIQSGTNWTPGWYQIASVASNKATLTATIGTAVLYGTATTDYGYHRPNGLNTAAGCATVGTPTSGVWSIDYSQQTTGLAYTDLVIDGTTNTDATSAAKPFGKQQLGNIWNVTSGTGFTVQRVQLTSIPSGVVGRFDKSLGTLSSTGGNATRGGAIGSSSTLTALTQALVAGNKVYIKATGTYTLTVTTTVTAAAKGDTTNGRISVEGYTTYPGQRDGRPLITSATNSVALITLNDNDYFELVHLNLTHTAATRGNGVTHVTSGTIPVYGEDLVIDGCAIGWNIGVGSGTFLYLTACEIKNCTAQGLLTATTAVSFYLYGCDIHDNASDGIKTAASGGNFVFAWWTIFDTNAIGINNLATSGGTNTELYGCVFVDNASDGFQLQATGASGHIVTLVNNIFYNNGGYGGDSGDELIITEAQFRGSRNNAYGANTSGPINGYAHSFGDVALTADPFTNRAGRDFSLNNTAGGGAALRAAGFPHAFANGTTTSYLDIGAAQHQDSGGSAGMLYIPNLSGV